ncbi:methionyl-tRNA formyltransferase [Granulicella cerasi]|uniref:Methionyl-tRNA formyltransferase n=1 Tax=Granulicella cerasi TaxID=741063 RepID=A0ABW1Z6Q4_9BACT|nr:methionyl-tRNA formyltransferase [Granulicella cerasi]
MKLVFCGTPLFAVPSLKAVLAAGHEVALVLTQPDKPAGRGMALRPSSVKQFALEQGLAVAQPDKLRNNVEIESQLREIAPDAICVVAYGKLIPTWMLELPRFGNINVHGSLLPKYRGAAPIQWAVANGEAETGVTTMLLNEGLDTGDMLLERRLAIPTTATSAELFPQLSEVGASALVETLAGLEAGTIQRQKQDDSEATLAPQLTREDGNANPAERNALCIFNRWRGFQPWPGAYTMLRGKRFILKELSLVSEVKVSAGTLEVRDGKLLMGTSDGSALELLEVQLEGKPAMPGGQFARDFQVKSGERVG